MIVSAARPGVAGRKLEPRVIPEGLPQLTVYLRQTGGTPEILRNLRGALKNR